jgi:hypothetical protein
VLESKSQARSHNLQRRRNWHDHPCSWHFHSCSWYYHPYSRNSEAVADDNLDIARAAYALFGNIAAAGEDNEADLLVETVCSKREDEEEAKRMAKRPQIES